MLHQAKPTDLTGLDNVETYSQRANPAFESIMALRSAAKEGAFFLSHIRPGMSVLDVGCGPGSITLGIAEAVGEGEVIGVDLQLSQVEQARALASARGITNARFEVADVYRLPFSDASIDAVFAHAVLMHLREPLQALKEIRRVLRPGGVIGVRDCDWGGRMIAPASPKLDEWFALTVRVRERNGGNPFMARHHRQLLLKAGFERAEASVSTWSAGTAQEIDLCTKFLKAQLRGFAATVLAEGWMDVRGLEEVENEMDEWGRRPDGLYVDVYCEGAALAQPYLC